MMTTNILGVEVEGDSDYYPQYENHFGYDLERIDLLFQQDYIKQLDEPPVSLRPFILSEQEIAQRRNNPRGAPAWMDTVNSFLPDSIEALTAKLHQVKETFYLTRCELDVLLTCMLPRLSDHYINLPGSEINEGVSQRLMKNFFSGSQAEYRALQAALHASSLLFRFQLITEVKQGINKGSETYYVISEAVWYFFAGNASSLIYRHPCTRWAKHFGITGCSPLISQQLFTLCLDEKIDKLPVIILEGHEQDGREHLLASIAMEYNYKTLCLDTEMLLSQPEIKQQQCIAEIMRDVMLEQAVIMLDNCNGKELSKSGCWKTFLNLLQKIRLPVFIVPQQGRVAPDSDDFACIHVDVPCATTSEKAMQLQLLWPRDCNEEEQQALYQLAERYFFNITEIRILLKEAHYYRCLRDKLDYLRVEDLRQALLKRSRKNFSNLAQRITPVRTFDDFIASSALKEQLAEVLFTIKLRDSVVNKHFSHKTGGKTGVSVLFYGDSGTGKTLAAEVLAQQLGVDLIKVDLSAVVNKYVGETEKNLARIFDLAQTDSGVLFFDEADALFGKRSETKDAHDRHANIEVSYLLQRLESYPGLVILATNNRGHLDNAFNRRFTFIIRFIYPDVTLQKKMWESIWPATLKLDRDIDFTALANKSELTGANIRNVALLAAVLAAEEKSDVITIKHIEHAIRREMNKLGRIPR